MTDFIMFDSLLFKIIRKLDEFILGLIKSSWFEPNLVWIKIF